MSQPTCIQLASKEGRMAFAIDLYQLGYFTSIREAVVIYKVSCTTLQARLQGYTSQQEKRSTNLKLIDTEEFTLVDWILSIDEQGLLLYIASIRDIANLLLQKRTDIDASSIYYIGIQWPYNFV